MERENDICKEAERNYPRSIQYLLDVLSDLLIKLNIHPNTLSLSSLLFAAIAGICLYLGQNRVYLSLAVPFILLNALFDGLDGKVARKTGKSNKLGDYLDCTIDELSDSFLFIGIAFSGLCNSNLAFLALVFKLLLSSFGLSARVCGTSTIGRGVLHRANRLAFLVGAGLIESVFQFGEIYSFLTLFDLLMLFFIFGGVLTILQRFVFTFNVLKEE